MSTRIHSSSLAGLFVPALVCCAQTPPVADRFLQLFDQLRAAETTHQPVALRLTDLEINDYLRYSLQAVPRPGLESLTVKIFPANYISTFTVIDFDAVERWHPGTIPTLLRPVLNGKKSLWLDYRFQAQDSLLTFSVEKARFENIPIPAFVMGEVIKIVGARQPEKYDTGKPVPIPFGIHRLWTLDHVLEGRN